MIHDDESSAAAMDGLDSLSHVRKEACLDLYRVVPAGNRDVQFSHFGSPWIVIGVPEAPQPDRPRLPAMLEEVGESDVVNASPDDEHRLSRPVQ